MEQARVMELRKDIHIEQILKNPEISYQWSEVYNNRSIKMILPIFIIFILQLIHLANIAI